MNILQTLVIRPVTHRDDGQMMALAKLAGFSMTSLPQDEAVMHRKIEHAVQSFAGKPPRPNQHTLLFVLEDQATGRIVGTTGIKAHVGLSEPYYSYKLSTLVHANSDLDIYTRQKVLHMVNDFTGTTEISALFLHAHYRRHGLGAFLSRVRFLIMAEFPDLFADTVVAEIRGTHDSNGESPFYNNLARHFFQMPFYQADYIYATKGNQFISDLMPRYPIYVTLLSPAAQEVIGVPFADSKPAARLLMEEGFYHEGYVDLFDAGPTLQAERRRIATVSGSRKAAVAAVTAIRAEKRFMIANTDLGNLRVVLDAIQENPDNTVAVSPEAARRLQVVQGDHVRFAPQFPAAGAPAQKEATAT